MKTSVLISGLVAASLMIVEGVSFAGGAFWERQKKQHIRIGYGLKSGDITGREYGRLMRQQAQIQRQKKKFWKDGRLDLRERRALAHLQGRASKHIYRAKHNPRQVKHKHYGKRCNRQWKRLFYHGHRGYRFSQRHGYRKPSFGDNLRGVIIEPGWLLAWSVGLD